MSEAELAALSRSEFGRLVALLAGRLGAGGLELAEDAVQDAFAAAVRTWSQQGPPRDPRAWLYRAAWNRVIDQRRRAPSAPLPEDLAAAEPPGGPDPELALILLCCDPALPTESQVALTLKVAAGFSVTEIARLLGAGESAIEQRLVRAKRTLRSTGIATDGPPEDRARRSAVALEVLYAMFAEGYASPTTPSGLRRDLCFEAIRLVQLVLADPATVSPDAHALAALFALQASRLDAREGPPGGQPVSLREQDRSRWDAGLINAGLLHLAASRGPALSRYHLEAEIASCHAVAPAYAETDWDRIVEVYGLLADRWPSPVVALNLAIATGERDGPRASLAALDDMDGTLAGHPLYHAARADALERLGETAGSAEAWRRAAAAAPTDAVRDRLAARLSDLVDPPAADVGIGQAHPS